MEQKRREVRFLSIASDAQTIRLSNRQRKLEALCASVSTAFWSESDRVVVLRNSTILVSVFALIAFVCIFSAVSSEQNVSIVRWLELYMVVHLSAEFLARLWAVGADARYRGIGGRIAYLCRPICLIDAVVVGANVFALFWMESNETEQLQAIQFECSLLHVDRQMSTWALVRKMVQRSQFELVSAYYIALMILLTLAVCVYTAESHHNEAESQRERTFGTFDDSIWFSIVTMLTIGYGDIVPRGWLSKLCVCLFSYLGLSMFSAANGLVGVGMSLMLSDERQQRQRHKMRDLAARLLQSWYRFRLLSNERTFHSIRVFRRQCANLQRAEQRILSGRAEIQRMRERKQSRQQGTLARMLCKTAVSPQNNKNNTIGAAMPTMVPLESLHKMSIQLSKLAPIEVEGNFSDDFAAGEGEEEERILDFYYYNQRSHSNSASSRRSEEAANEMDDRLCGRYRSMLRMCYFFAFITLRKRFARAREPSELADAERELCEMEYQKVQRFKELEARLDAQLGMGMALDGSGTERPLLRRMEQCEQKMAQIDRNLDAIERMAEWALEALGKENEGNQWGGLGGRSASDPFPRVKSAKLGDQL